jgi:hypothetical protein
MDRLKNRPITNLQPEHFTRPPANTAMVYITVDEDGDLHQITPTEWSQLPEKRIFNNIEEELHYIKLRLLQKSQENLKLWEYVQKVSKSKSNSTDNFIERTLKINEILQTKLDQIFSGRLSDLFDLLVLIELLSLGYWFFKKFKLWMYPPPKVRMTSEPIILTSLRKSIGR